MCIRDRRRSLYFSDCIVVIFYTPSPTSTVHQATFSKGKSILASLFRRHCITVREPNYRTYSPHRLSARGYTCRLLRPRTGACNARPVRCHTHGYLPNRRDLSPSPPADWFKVIPVGDGQNGVNDYSHYAAGAQTGSMWEVYIADNFAPYGVHNRPQ